MSGRSKLACAFVVLGSFLLCASAALHVLAGHSQGFPALDASDLAPPLKSAFRVIFLAVAWHWVVITVVVLLAAFTQTKLRRILIVFCGLAVLAEAAAGGSVMGFFIGNEIIGAAALLFLSGGLLFDGVGIETRT